MKNDTVNIDVYTISDSVQSAIISERLYQKQKWGEGYHSVAEWVLFINQYALQAMAATAKSGDLNAGLDAIRKVTALGVAAMEQHWAPQRKGFKVRHKSRIEKIEIVPGRRQTLNTGFSQSTDYNAPGCEEKMADVYTSDHRGNPI